MFLAPSFASQANLQQISSNALANIITVSVPEVDDSGGPVRYILQLSSNKMYYSIVREQIKG